MGKIWFKISSVFLMVIFTSAACTPMVGPAETLKVPWGETVDWLFGKSILEQKLPNGCGRVYELIPEDENSASWTELVYFGSLAKNCGNYSLSEWFKIKQSKQEEICSDANKWNIIKKNKNRLIFEHKAKNCAGNPDQVRIGIIVDGTTTRFEVEYNLREDEIPEPKRSKLISALSASEVIR